MKITAEGRDGFGIIKVVMPDHCEVCDTDQDVVVTYAPLSTLKKSFETLGIDLLSTIIGYKYGMHGVRAKKIGVTCGCYAKFHRQVAHITTRRTQKKTKSPRGVVPGKVH